MGEEFLYACCIFVGDRVVRGALKGILKCMPIWTIEVAHPYE
jgi:hypothetical protein